MESKSFFKFHLSLVAVVVLVGATVFAADETSEQTKQTVDDVTVLARKIDQLLAVQWTAEKIVTAAPADDAEFLRRVYIDIAGKIPSVADVREFLADKSTGKRRALVDRLLQGSGYVKNFTNKWRTEMLPETNSNLQTRYLVPGFEAWLRRRLIDNTGYDGLVHELLTTKLQGVNPYGGNTPTPLAFFMAKETKPENLAASTSRIFLGLRIECAQCHDHPFDEWQRDQFWSFATFFSGMSRANPSSGILGQIQEFFSSSSELTIPGTNQTVSARYLDGKKLKGNGDPRTALADWVTSSNNPYFARTAANRMWAHFFGIGIVDPVDDFTRSNKPSHPRLLDELSAGLTNHSFDMKFLIRAITSSQAYQLTSRKPDQSQRDPRLFAQMALKGMTSAQLYDSVAEATGHHESFSAQASIDIRGTTSRSQFQQLFSDENSAPTERQTTVLQALGLMNGAFVTNATSLQSSKTLSAIAEFPQFKTADRIEALYLATLSRRPRPDEIARLVKYVDAGGPKNNSKLALGDVFWSLLNCSEFVFNH